MTTTIDSPKQLPALPDKVTIVAYSETLKTVAALVKKFEGAVYAIDTTEGMEAAKRDRRTLIDLRVGLEKTRVEKKAPPWSECLRIDAEAKAITAVIVALEDPIAAQVKTGERRKEEAKAAKAKAARDAAEAQAAAKLAAERAKQEAAAKIERDRLAAEKAAQAEERAKLDAERQELQQAQAAQKAEADRIAESHRELARAKRQAEAADLRRQAAALAAPAAPQRPVPIEPSRQDMALAERLDGEAQAFEGEAKALVIPVVTDAGAATCAELGRLERALELAREDPWREVERIADDVYQLLPGSSSDLRALAAKHGGDIPAMESQLMAAKIADGAAHKADDESRAASEVARQHRADLDGKATELRTRAAALREQSHKAASEANAQAQAAYQIEEREWRKAADAVDTERRALLAKAEAP